jgi:hypothetical protein
VRQLLVMSEVQSYGRRAYLHTTKAAEVHSVEVQMRCSIALRDGFGFQLRHVGFPGSLSHEGFPPPTAYHVLCVGPK